MKANRTPTAKLRLAKAVWRSFYPESSFWGARLNEDDFRLSATRSLGAGVSVDWFVRAWKVDDVSCSLRVRMALHDKRVAILQSTATELDLTRLNFLDFDVLAASSVMDGKEMPDSPLFASDAQVEEFARIVEGYSTRIDRIWNFVGGLSVQGVERLAVWAVRNYEPVGTLWTNLGGICAAFVYGERDLGYELMAAYRSHWERRVQLEPRQAVFEVFDGVRRDLERLQDAVRTQTTH